MKRRKVTDPEVRKLVELAVHQGWGVQWTEGSHIKFLPRGHAPIVTGGTPSDHRSIKNLKARLRRAGLEIPRKGASS